MNFLDKRQSASHHPTTEGFYFGKSESEGENSYKISDDSPFDDYLNILPKINNEGCFIITGRKGSGKSAIAKYFKDNANFENSMFCEIIKSDAIKLEKQIQNNTSDSDEKLVSFFQWLILVKLIKLILASNNGEYTSELKAIRNFVKNNSGIADIDKLPITEITKLNRQELNIGALSPFKGTVERVLGKRVGDKAPFYKLLPALKEIVFKILRFQVFQDYQFIIIFDDLDLGFKSYNSQDKLSLLELIRVAKEFNNDLRVLNNTKILILLRDDIKKILSGFDADVSKIFSTYEIELKWYDGKDESKTLLREFVNRRIANNFKHRKIKYEENDPWKTLFHDSEGCYGEDRNDYKSAFKYISDYTFLRPRDMILFLKNVSAGKYPYPIKGDTIGILLQKYAKENEAELKAELAIHYSQEQIQSIFQILKSLSYSQISGFGNELVLEKLSEQGLGEETFQTLVDYFLLIPFDPTTGKYYIGYRDSDPADYDIDIKNLKYRLHKCIFALFVPKSTMPNNVY